MADEYYDEDEIEPIEGYCMSCRESVEIEEPQAVWTRKGMPATRGICPICGGVVFRMGRTHTHKEAERPEAVEVGDSGRRNRPRLQRDTAYVLYAEADEEIAQRIAADLDNAGIATWLHEHVAAGDKIAWAGGVHPALRECSRMIYVLSPNAENDSILDAAWGFFRDQRKSIIIVQIDNAPPPDRIRRSPRFDFSGDYKRAFRQMMQTLG